VRIVGEHRRGMAQAIQRGGPAPGSIATTQEEIRDLIEDLVMLGSPTVYSLTVELASKMAQATLAMQQYWESRPTLQSDQLEAFWKELEAKREEAQRLGRSLERRINKELRSLWREPLLALRPSPSPAPRPVRRWPRDLPVPRVRPLAIPRTRRRVAEPRPRGDGAPTSSSRWPLA
jgi:hypothetical protein